MNLENFTGCFYGRAFTILLLSFCIGLSVSAQNDDENIEIPVEAQQFFDKLVPKKDTTNTEELKKYRQDKFIKRISFHTNVIDWATLVPNIGLEIDLKDSPRNNYSVSIFGKYNGNSTHGSLVYNVAAVRVEGRKYWRTGKYGSQDQDLYMMPEFEADSLAASSYGLDSLGRKAKKLGVKFSQQYPDYTQEQKDSVDSQMDSLGLNKNGLRKWFYNTYNKVSRNVTSGRSLDNPRNWRAYYFGIWAGYDDWNVSLTGNGKRGQGLGLGILGGYTIPLLPQKYPKEGSLDLDLGLAIGVKGVKYDAYTYVAANPEGQRYVDNPAKSQTSWKIVPYPVIQDIHVSLVWRFRGIKNKVDRSLIDDYFNKVENFESSKNVRSNTERNKATERENLARLIQERIGQNADSTSIWDSFHLARLANARKINPDTIFTDEDYILYLKITNKVDTTKAKFMLNRIKEETKDSLERVARQARRDSIATADSISKQLRINARQARRDSIAAADSISRALRLARRDSIATADSIAEVLRDASRKFKRDSIAAADSIAKALRIARRDSIAAADSIADALREAERKARRDSIAAADSLAKAMKKEERKNKAKKKKDKDAPVEESGNSAETPVLPVGEDEDAQQGDVKKDEE